ncbi:MAG: dihydroorotase [Clostridia bacterium]|nr:dihydroorotase [Clostridia bacterium]
MKTLLKNAMIFTEGKFTKSDLEITDRVITNISANIEANGFDVVYDLNNMYLLPGLIDVHTHLREPGFIYKETIATGSYAGAKGGYTSICAMPNLNPTPDCMENLQIELDAIEKDAKIHVYPYGTITVGEKGEELADLKGIADKVIAFSDDGHGVQKEGMMLEAMKQAKELGKMVVAHCEENSLLNGGYIHDGEYAKLHGHKGICSASEWVPIKRDIELSRQTGCHYHVCHISTKESVELIRQAKKEGVPITCETGPHYLTMNDMQIKEEGRFKMNPPIRSEEDRLALIEGIKDGTIDLIITDHAPHSAEEKSKGLAGSAMGVVGLEVCFPVLYTNLVKPGIITLEKLLELMNSNATKIFGIGSELKVGAPADMTVYDLNEEYDIDSSTFVSMGKATPFDGNHVFGRCKMTFCDGKLVFGDGAKK